MAEIFIHVFKLFSTAYSSERQCAHGVDGVSWISYDSTWRNFCEGNDVILDTLSLLNLFLSKPHTGTNFVPAMPRNTTCQVMPF